MILKFSDLQSCPYCGSEEYYVFQRVTGVICYTERFDGGEADNSTMYESLEHSPPLYNKVYCRECDRCLGNYKKDKLSVEVIKKCAETENKR